MDNVVSLRQFPGKDAPESRWRVVVGEELRAERQRRSERIADVASRAGISPQYLSEVERGVKDASSEVLSAITGFLDLRVADLAQRVSHRLRSSSTADAAVRIGSRSVSARI